MNAKAAIGVSCFRSPDGACLVESRRGLGNPVGLETTVRPWYRSTCDTALHPTGNRTPQCLSTASYNLRQQITLPPKIVKRRTTPGIMVTWVMWPETDRRQSGSQFFSATVP